VIALGAFVIGILEPASGGWWHRLQPYLDYPGFEVWKFFNLAVFASVLVYIIFRKANLGLAFTTRRETIKNELEKARQERDAALAKLAEVEERLAGLDNQIASINETAKREAAAERERIAKSTEAEIAKLTAQGQRDIENAARTAKKDLQRFTAEQSVRLAEEILRREMRPEDDARMIGRNIEEMGAAR
jgi:F0F1-type ATP synthase membrane subunit b/b'